MPARRGMVATVALACDGKEGEGVALRGQEEEEEEEGAGGQEGRWKDAEGSERAGRRGDGRMREREGSDPGGSEKGGLEDGGSGEEMARGEATVASHMMARRRWEE